MTNLLAYAGMAVAGFAGAAFDDLVLSRFKKQPIVVPTPQPTPSPEGYAARGYGE